MKEIPLEGKQETEEEGERDFRFLLHVFRSFLLPRLGLCTSLGKCALFYTHVTCPCCNFFSLILHETILDLV